MEDTSNNPQPTPNSTDSNDDMNDMESPITSTANYASTDVDASTNDGVPIQYIDPVPPPAGAFDSGGNGTPVAPVEPPNQNQQSSVDPTPVSSQTPEPSQPTEAPAPPVEGSQFGTPAVMNQDQSVPPVQTPTPPQPATAPDPNISSMETTVEPPPVPDISATPEVPKSPPITEGSIEPQVTPEDIGAVTSPSPAPPPPPPPPPEPAAGQQASDGSQPLSPVSPAPATPQDPQAATPPPPNDDLLTDKVHPDDLDMRWNSWKCLNCEYFYEGHNPLMKCPRCGNEDPDKFD